MFKKIKKILLIASIFLCFGVSVFAQSEFQIDYPNAPGRPDVFNTGRVPLLPTYINYILNILIAISGAVIFFIVVKAGFKYFTARDSASKRGDAKDDIFAAFLGLIILLSSYLILNFISPTYTTLTLGLKTLGIILQNGGGEETLISSGESDLSDFIPIKIIISKGYIETAEITLYSQKNYEGSIRRIRKSEWNCGEKECSAEYPLDYRKGSITVLIVRPGIFIYKNKKIPYYVGSDVANTMALNDLANGPGVVDGIRIYNSSTTHYGAMTFVDNNYIGPGTVYLPPKKEGWASDEVINLSRIFAIKTFNVKEFQPDLAEYFYKPEYDYTSICSKTEENLRSIPWQQINCGYQEYVYSTRINNAWQILVSAGTLDNPDRLQKLQAYLKNIPDMEYLQPFSFGEIIKVSDPNMDDNPEIGQCVCNGRFAGILWCVNWQSCATHSLIFSK